MRRMIKPKRPSFLPMSAAERVIESARVANTAARKSIQRFSPKLSNPSARRLYDSVDLANARAQVSLENPEFVGIVRSKNKKRT